MDAWGKPESGILDGNINFEGRYFECLSAKFDNNVASQYCAFHLAIPVSLVSFASQHKKRLNKDSAERVCTADLHIAVHYF